MAEEEAPDAQAAFAAALARPGALPPDVPPAQARRFDIHRNNVAHGMIEALGASFPAVRRLVGGEFFAALARAYLAADPPCSPLLFRYGGGFAGFVETFPPAAPVPYLADVARLEWLWLQAYHAADAEPAQLSALAALPPDRLGTARLLPHPSLGLLASRFPVVSIWAASTDRGPDSAVDMARAEAAAVVRPGLAVDVRRLDPGAHAFLAALAAGEPLGAAAGAAAMQQEAPDLQTLIAGVFEIGAIAAIRAGDGDDVTEGDDG